MRTVIALRLLAATLLFCGWSFISCAGETNTSVMLNLFSREEAGVTHFYVQNLQIASVTATFNLHATNLQASAKFPYTTTLAGNQTLDAFTLTPIKPDAPWQFSVARSSLLGSATAVPDASFVYLLPYAPGSSFVVSQGYHGKFSHTGPDEYAIDWRMPVGTPVYAAREGLVVQSKDDMDQGGPDRKFETSANFILVEHSDGTMGIYGHLKQGGNQVKVGDRVKAGDFIGLSGNTGFSNGPHLHFAIFKTRDGSQRVSLPVKFRTARDAKISLAVGKSYTAAPRDRQPDVLVSASR
jgi:murein DD-endopeptidase MepM/ murein hydrolase activator NlpD